MPKQDAGIPDFPTTETRFSAAQTDLDAIMAREHKLYEELSAKYRRFLLMALDRTASQPELSWTKIPWKVHVADQIVTLPMTTSLAMERLLADDAFTIEKLGPYALGELPFPKDTLQSVPVLGNESLLVWGYTRFPETIIENAFAFEWKVTFTADEIDQGLTIERKRLVLRAGGLEGNPRASSLPIASPSNINILLSNRNMIFIPGETSNRETQKIM